MPTANSAQTSSSRSKITEQTINFEEKVLSDLIIRLIRRADPKSKIPAIIKSNDDQFQPSTKRFPKNAAESNKAGTAKMNGVFCFVVIIF